MWGLIMPSGRTRILPFTAITYSLRRSPASACICTSTSGVKTTCTLPDLSHSSMKITPPWSRRLRTQPLSTISLPTSSSPTSPHLTVRFQLESKIPLRIFLQTPLSVQKSPTKRRVGTALRVFYRVPARDATRAGTSARGTSSCAAALKSRTAATPRASSSPPRMQAALAPLATAVFICPFMPRPA